jgi:hypothetical protein
MPLILPDFTNRRCVEISSCGYVIPEERDQIQPPQELKKGLIARYEKSGKLVYLGLVKPFPGEKMHLHLSLATIERFGDTPPELNSEANTVLETVNAFLGKRIDVYLRGLFLVPRAALPPFIRSPTATTIADDVQVRMTAATLAVRGAPIHSISWELRGRMPAEIILEARTQLTFDESYLDQGLDLLESAFRAFIVREANDA